MKRSEILNKIYSFDSDRPYMQLLETIFINLPETDWKRFYNMIVNAEQNDSKIVVNEKNLPAMWDSLSISDLRIK